MVSARVIQSPYFAMNAELEVVEIKKSVGRISGSAVCVYPPGIPIIFPGEMITLDIANYINESYELGFEVIGLYEIEDTIDGIEDTIDDIEDTFKVKSKNGFGYEIRNHKKRGINIQCLK